MSAVSNDGFRMRFTSTAAVLMISVCSVKGRIVGRISAVPHEGMFTATTGDYVSRRRTVFAVT